MNEITKQRAGRCITHHYACDCREYCHQQEVAALRLEVERLKHALLQINSTSWGGDENSPCADDAAEAMRDIAIEALRK